MLLASVQLWVLLVLHVIIFAMCLVALVDAARRPPAAFPAAGKRTKTFWLVLLGVALAIAFIALPYPLGIGGLGFFIAAMAAGAAGVYLVDVRPAVDPYSGGRGRGPGPRSPGGRGGW